MRAKGSISAAAVLVFSALILYVAMLNRSAVLSHQQVKDHLERMQALAIAESAWLYVVQTEQVLPSLPPGGDPFSLKTAAYHCTILGAEAWVFQNGPTRVVVVETLHGIRVRYEA